MHQMACQNGVYSPLKMLSTSFGIETIFHINRYSPHPEKCCKSAQRTHNSATTMIARNLTTNLAENVVLKNRVS